MKHLSVVLMSLTPFAANAGGMGTSPDSDMISIYCGALLLVGIIYLSYKVVEWRNAKSNSEELTDTSEEIQE